MNWRVLPALICAAVSIAPPPAYAACNQCGCGVESSGLVFDPYNPRRPAAPGTGTVRVTCQGDSGYTINVSPGSSGTPLNRTMHNGAAVLNYNLFKDSGRSLIWGDGTAGQSGVSGTGTLTYSIYGSIFTGQQPVVGLYTDTLVVSVEY